MGALEMGQQLLLFHIGNNVLGLFVRQAGLLHLQEEGFHRTAYGLGKLFDGHFSHVASYSAVTGLIKKPLTRSVVPRH